MILHTYRHRHRHRHKHSLLLAHTHTLTQNIILHTHRHTHTHTSKQVMSVDGLPPMVLIGLEGVWGMVLMCLIVFPLAYYTPGGDTGGSVENVWDSLVMVQNSKPLQLILVAFFVSVACYNIFAIYVTHFLSSVWHAILDNFRPISVWGECVCVCVCVCVIFL